MSLNARFSADFSAFEKAVAGAQVHVQAFEKGVQTAARDLARMADGFSGANIVAEATRMVAVIDEIGGATKLTEGEQARVNAVLEEALAKYRVLGTEAPKALQDLAQATRRVSVETDDWAGRSRVGAEELRALGVQTSALAGGLGEVDRILSVAGVNVGRHVGALAELSAVAGKTAGQLGVLGTAGAAAGAVLGAWSLGRAIAQALELDEAVASLAARLFGFGDVAEEVAGAKLDQLARASAIARREITDLNEALTIIAVDQAAFAGAQQMVERIKGASKRLHDDMAKDTREWADEMVRVAVEGHNKRFAAASEVARKEEELLTRVARAYADAVRATQDDLFGEDDIAKALRYADALVDVEGVARLSASAQAEVARVMRAGTEALVLAGRGADGLTSRFEELRVAAVATATDAAAAFQKLQAEAQLLQAYEEHNARVDALNGRRTELPVGDPGGLAGLYMRSTKLAGLDDYANSRLAGLHTPMPAPIVVNIDARESFYDTPSSLQRLASKVKSAISGGTAR